MFSLLSFEAKLNPDNRHDYLILFFQSAVLNKTASDTSPVLSKSQSVTKTSASGSKSTKKSQLALLAGAVKRKR